MFYMLMILFVSVRADLLMCRASCNASQTRHPSPMRTPSHSWAIAIETECCANFADPPRCSDADAKSHLGATNGFEMQWQMNQIVSRCGHHQRMCLG